MSISCLTCGYAVTEPICASCVIKEVKIWLNEKNVKKNIMRKVYSELQDLSKQIDSLDYVLFPSKDVWKLSVMKCIKCKDEMHLMCFYCVNHQATKIINDNLKSKSYIDNLNESFNIELYDYEFFLKLGKLTQSPTKLTN